MRTNPQTVFYFRNFITHSRLQSSWSIVRNGTNSIYKLRLEVFGIEYKLQEVSKRLLVLNVFTSDYVSALNYCLVPVATASSHDNFSMFFARNVTHLRNVFTGKSRYMIGNSEFFHFLVHSSEYCLPWGSRSAALVKALASHPCVTGSIPVPDVMSWLSVFLLILSLLREFFSGYFGFPISAETNISIFQFDPECEGRKP